MAGPRDCVPSLLALGQWEMATWASHRPIRHGWRGRTCLDLWDAAPRGEWLLAWARRSGVPASVRTRAAAACLHLSPGPSNAGMATLYDRAVHAAERWAAAPTPENRTRATRHVGVIESNLFRFVGSPDNLEPMMAAKMLATSVWNDLGPEMAVNSASAAAHLRHSHAQEEGGGREGPDPFPSGCADAVRRLVPFLELPAGRAR